MNDNPNPLQSNVIRINNNLTQINNWVKAIKNQGANIQSAIRRDADVLLNTTCKVYIEQINEQLNALLETIGDGQIGNVNGLPNPSHSVNKVMTGGYYYPSSSSRRIRSGRKKRKNKRSRR